jgi:hypothetical protein
MTLIKASYDKTGTHAVLMQSSKGKILGIGSSIDHAKAHAIKQLKAR